MPKAKTKSTKKVVKKQESSESFSSEISSKKLSQDYLKYLPSKRISIALILIGLGAILYLNKDWFVAGTVNGKPVLASEVNQRLNDTYRTQVLNQIINEKIIEQEAQSKGVSISDDVVNSKIKEIEDQYGGADTFNSLLSQQGVTRDQFTKQTKLQLVVENLYKDSLNPTEEEIQKFMEENSSLPEATEPAKFRELASSQIKQQKLSEVFSQKFQELRSSANIQLF